MICREIYYFRFANDFVPTELILILPMKSPEGHELKSYPDGKNNQTPMPRRDPDGRVLFNPDTTILQKSKADGLEYNL